jgi:hypothetical protein
MQNVSTFELLFKPQAPVPNVERVVQGYFLTISNLEPKEYRYRVEFVVFPPPPGTPNQAFRSPAGNTLTFVDTGGVDNAGGTLTGGLASSTFTPSSGLIRVPAHGSALLAVLPSVFPSPLDPTPVVDPVLEIRGYVKISLPALLAFNPLRLKAQSAAPVKVLLTPQQRATFYGAANQITDQIQASLPTANGKAQSSITPNPGGPIVFPPVRELEGAFTRLEPVAEADRFAALMGMLAKADRTAMDADPARVVEEA